MKTTRRPTLLNLDREPLTLGEFFNDGWGQMFNKPFFADMHMKDENFTPKIEVKQDKEKMYVMAELPGINADDVHIYINDDMLTIEGEKKTENKKDENGQHYSERTYGYFKRNIAMPFAADTEKVQANFKDGLLNVTISAPANATKKTKEVLINK